jgi:hypothetical protein
MGNRIKSIEEYYDNLVYHLPQENTVFRDSVDANKHVSMNIYNMHVCMNITLINYEN